MSCPTCGSNPTPPMDIQLGSIWTLDCENSSDDMLYFDRKGGGCLTVDTTNEGSVVVEMCNFAKKESSYWKFDQHTSNVSAHVKADGLTNNK